MSIRKRGKDSWEITIHLGWHPETGKRVRGYHSFTGTKKGAEAEERRLLRERDLGTYIEPSSMNTEDMLLLWLEHVQPKVATRTHERHQEIVEKHLVPAFKGALLAKLRPLHIQGYLDRARASGRLDKKGGLSPTTVRYHHAVLREGLNHAVRMQLIATNPALAARPPRYTRKETNVLTEAQTAQPLKAAEGTDLYAPLVIATCTGLRRGELLGLMWGDINLEIGALVVRRTMQATKTGLKFKAPKSAQSKRTVTLPAFAVEVLNEHLKQQTAHRRVLGVLYEDQDLVFPREDGRPWEPSRFSTRFREFEDGLDLLRIRLHDLRHVHCSHLIRQGTPLKMASARMGYSTIATTADLYAHVLEGQDRAAADLFNIALSEAFQEVVSSSGASSPRTANRTASERKPRSASAVEARAASKTPSKSK